MRNKQQCSRQSGWRLAVKRTLDLTCAAMALVILSPVLALVAFAIWATMGRPVVFRQARPGKNGRSFRVVKFRTMNGARDGSGQLLPDGERLTKLGRFLRASSLDELPQLWNVVKGEMSLVGPRPLLMEYLERYTPEQARRHEVIPGVTGWAQVNGRQDIPFSKRLEYDVWYVDNWSLRLEFKILFRTLLPVVQGQGVRSGQNVIEVDDIGLTAVHKSGQWTNDQN